MVVLRSKEDTYDWFQQIQGWSRMDFLCNLIHLCNPFELRFIGACIEDMAQTDFHALRDREVKANSVENLNQFISKNPPVDQFRCHILVCLALLQSSNYKVASKLADLLNVELERLNLEHVMQAGLDAEVEQWMLMLTLAVYHPAFRFEKKCNFKNKLLEYEIMNEKERKPMSWCRRSHRCSQLQHATEDCDDAGWSADTNPDSVPFQHCSVRPKWGYKYVDYNRDPYQGRYSHGNIPDGVVRPPNMIPSTFPGPMMPPLDIAGANIVEEPIGVKCSQKTDYVGYNIESPRDERTILHFNGEPQALPSSVPNSRNKPSNFPGTAGYFPSQRSTANQPTVPQAHSCSNVSSALSTAVTTTVKTQTMSHSTQSGGEYLSWGGGYRTTGTKPRQFITIPKSDSGKHIQSSNRVHCESQRLRNRNRSQSGDTNSGTRKWQKTPENPQNLASPKPQLRPSASAPVLAWNKEEQNAISSSFKEQETEKKQNLRNKEEASHKFATKNLKFTTKKLKPTNVSVNIAPKNKKEGSKLKGETRFALQVEWSDKTMSECYHSVEEMVKFYKQVTGKIVIDTDFLTKQNNQIFERRKKLERIFSEIVSSMVTDSNLDQFMVFFKYKQPPSSLPPKKKKYRPVQKSRAALDESSSSSSTTSSQLVNNANGRLIASQSSRPESALSQSSSNSNFISPQNSRPESSLSPLSTKESISSSSVLSSPSYATPRRISVNDEEVHHDDHTRKDLYLKLYYWLQERNLQEHYTHFKKYKFDEFCKLQPSDINSLGFLSTEEKAILNDEITKMSKGVRPAKGEDTTLGTDMGKLSLSLEGKNEGNNAKDIKDILDDVARIQSEDEKSGLIRSAPVAFEMPNDDIQAVSSSSCFSFEFDSSSAVAIDTTMRSLRNNQKNDDDTDIETMTRDNQPGSENVGCYRPGNRQLSDPGRAWSQTEVGPIEYPVASVYMPRSAPPLPQMTSGHVMMGCYHIPSHAVVQTHAPISGSASISVGAQPTFAQAPIMTLPSPMLPHSGQKQTQYVYTVSNNSPGTMYPLPTSFYPVHSMSSPVGDGTTVSPIVYMNNIAPPMPEGENLYRSDMTVNVDSNKRVSPTLSDPDSSSKPQEVPLPQNMSCVPAEGVVSNRPGARPTNIYYNTAPSFQYMPQWGPPPHRHPLAPAYGDPTSFAPEQQTNEFFEYPAHHLPPGPFASNGYPDIRNSYSGPMRGRNRGMPHARHYSGDSAQKRTNIISCYNCGRKGHDASSCRDPNTVDLLGTDFHLKLSQSNNRRVNH